VVVAVEGTVRSTQGKMQLPKKKRPWQNQQHKVQGTKLNVRYNFPPDARNRNKDGTGNRASRVNAKWANGQMGKWANGQRGKRLVVIGEAKVTEGETKDWEKTRWVLPQTSVWNTQSREFN